MENGMFDLEKKKAFVCVLSGETTRDDLAAYKGTPPAIVVETFDKVDAQANGKGQQ